ncbi:hypothetical protein [Curtobacterium sp. L1-20]|uniref:hypothetical protein n=1 Tax=Curtobacterium sp. L1-20 TaxID=3138181 RepID=UPI003B526F9D
MGDDRLLTAPVMAPSGRKLRPRAWGLALAGVIALVVSGTLTSWSASIDHGGVDAAGHWIDDDGNVVATAPLTVTAQGHSAPVVTVVLVLVVAVGVLVPPTLERFGYRALGDVVRWAACLAVPVCVVAGVLVYGMWQGSVVMDQIQHGVVHPQGFPGGGVTVTTGHMTR